MLNAHWQIVTVVTTINPAVWRNAAVILFQENTCYNLIKDWPTLHYINFYATLDKVRTVNARRGNEKFTERLFSAWKSPIFKLIALLSLQMQLIVSILEAQNSTEI
jgi:hypothetical protein